MYQQITPGHKETQFPDLYTLMKRRNPEAIVADERNEAVKGLKGYGAGQYAAAFEPDGKWKPLGLFEDDPSSRWSYGAGAFDASWSVNRKDYGRERGDWMLLPKGKNTRKSTGGGEDEEDEEDGEDGEDEEDEEDGEDEEDEEDGDGSEDDDVPLTQRAGLLDAEAIARNDAQERANRMNDVNLQRGIEQSRLESQPRPQKQKDSTTQLTKKRANADGKKRVQPPPPKPSESSGEDSPAPNRSSGSAAGGSKKQKQTEASLRAKLTQILLGRHRVNRV